MEEGAVVSTSGKCQSEANKMQHCPWSSTYAHRDMFILILANDLLTLCSHNAETLRAIYHKRMAATKNRTCWARFLHESKKTTCMPAQMPGWDNAPAYVQGFKPWSEENQSDSSAGDSRESGSSQHTSRILLQNAQNGKRKLFPSAIHMHLIHYATHE